MPRNITAAVLCFATLALAACASRPPPPKIPHGVPFSGVEAPPPGSARLYVFRPDFAESLNGERPTLLVNGVAQSLLGREQYDSFSLKPGRHVIALSPGPKEASTWSSETSVELEAGAVYFLAAWNLTAYDTRTSLEPLWVGRYVTFVSQTYGSIVDAGVRFELVPNEQALPILRSMHRSIPSIASLKNEP
jgi:hypothetical protein